MSRARGGWTRWLQVAVGALLACLALGACQAGGVPVPTPSTTPSVDRDPVSLSLGVFGPTEETELFQRVVEDYNALSGHRTVSLTTWSSRKQMRDALAAGGAVPDVFLASRDDLAWLTGQRLVRPVDDLLDERGVDFGDNYARESLQGFSADDRLQCMPYGISPMVIYYNTDLIRFDRMFQRGLDVPDLATADAATPPASLRWTFDQFALAADVATRPVRGTRGLYVEPTLHGLAPFIYSGGGQLFDDTTTPTTLVFSDGDTQAALERSLVLLRKPQLTLTEGQVAKASPVEWFKRGKVGMIAGYRSLVPELRRVQGLNFDVMPMPVLDSAATVGDLSGMCLAADTPHIAEAADLLAYVTSTDAVIEVTRAGFLEPANVEVALSDDFLQSGRQPVHARVFNDTVRSIRLDPLMDTWPALDNAVAPYLVQLLTVPVLPDLDPLTQQIDQASLPVLSPATTSPSATPSAG